MDVFYSYTYGTAGWLCLQALPLIVTPKLILASLAKEAHTSTDLELYFCRSLGFSLVTLAVIVTLLTGSIPLSASASEPLSTDESDPRAPYAVPTLRVTTIFHALSAVYCYMSFVSSSQAGFALGIVGYGLMSAMGMWCMLFASEGGRISKRTGADKRTSGFPFKNAEADKKKVGRRRI